MLCDAHNYAGRNPPGTAHGHEHETWRLDGGEKRKRKREGEGKGKGNRRKRRRIKGIRGVNSEERGMRVKH